MASEIKVDTISEKTSAGGVTIDGLLIKDGGISGDVSLIGTTPTFTIGDAGAEDAALVFDGNAQDFYIALDDSADDLVIGLGSTVGTTPAISINSDRDVTISDGAIDFDVASHDTSNGLKLGGTLVTATAAELNIMDGVTSTAAEINLIDGGTARGTTALADGDGVLINDGGTMRMTNVTAVKTYMGLAVGDITGATALAVQPAADDEIIINDGGTLKRLDIKHIQNTPAFHASGGANGSIANNTEVVISNDDELFDSDGCYDTSTYRFTPAVAGKYYLYASARWQTSTTTATRLNIGIFKNGSEALGARNNNTDYSTVNVSGIVDMDADDYVDCRSYQNTGSTVAVSEEANLTFFGGFRISGV